MTDKTALRQLIEAVESGALEPDVPHAGFEWKQVSHLLTAYHGSLDAAKALHDALLPGLSVRITDSGPEYDHVGRWYVKLNWEHMDWQTGFTAAGPFGFPAQSETPARAWLISILKAYEAQQ